MLVGLLVTILVIVTAVSVSLYNSSKYYPLDTMILRADDMDASWTEIVVPTDIEAFSGQVEQMSIQIEHNATADDIVHSILTVHLLRFDSSQNATEALYAIEGTMDGTTAPWNYTYEGSIHQYGNTDEMGFNACFSKRSFLCIMRLSFQGISHPECICQIEYVIDKQIAKIQ